MSQRLALLWVPGQPIPWSPPRTVRTGRVGQKRGHRHIKAARLCAWQDAIRAEVHRLHLALRHRGPVALSFRFVATGPPGWWSDAPAAWWWSAHPHAGNPDLTNLVKAAEDAIRTYRQYTGKGLDRILVLEVPGVIEEDSQVCQITATKQYDRRAGVWITIDAIDEETGTEE